MTTTAMVKYLRKQQRLNVVLTLRFCLIRKLTVQVLNFVHEKESQKALKSLWSDELKVVFGNFMNLTNTTKVVESFELGFKGQMKRRIQILRKFNIFYLATLNVKQFQKSQNKLPFPRINTSRAIKITLNFVLKAKTFWSFGLSKLPVNTNGNGPFLIKKKKKRALNRKLIQFVIRISPPNRTWRRTSITYHNEPKTMSKNWISVCDVTLTCDSWRYPER